MSFSISTNFIHKCSRIAVGLHLDESRKLPYAGLVFTFGALHESSLANTEYGFGGKYLISKGYVVCSILDSKKIWYQNIDPVVTGKINVALSHTNFSTLTRFAYGSSMGGFGALLFAPALKVKKVLALSPQFSIWEQWDKTWESYANQVDEPSLPSAELYKASDTSVIIAVDSTHRDNLHVLAYEKIIPKNRLKVISLPLGGHPVSAFLSEIGLLKSLVTMVFDNDGEIDFCVDKKAAHLSPTYRYNLAVKLRRLGKKNLSLKLLKSSIPLCDGDGIKYEIYRLICILTKEIDNHALPGVVESAVKCLPGMKEKFNSFI